MKQTTIALLGKKVSDKITKFSGTCTGIATYITGCDQVLIAPECKKDDMSSKPEAHWFDVNRVDAMPEESEIQIDTSEDNGPGKSPEKRV